MEAVTGHVEFRSESKSETEAFISSSCNDLDGRRIEIRKAHGQFVVEVCESEEPAS
jgi:hypothetical protein